LFGTAGSTANDAKSTNITISTPASYWQDANNTLLFRHTSKGGYVIYDVTVQFEVSTEPVVTGSVTLSWTAPVAREDETPISMSEIKGFRIYYGTVEPPGVLNYTIKIDDAYADKKTLNGLAPGNYNFVLTTIDTEGRESVPSEMVFKSI
jgi:hypothetical protein